MCGIAALFSLKGISSFSPEDLRRMTDLINHRGPDDEGYALFTPEQREPYHNLTPQIPFIAALGHKRLSIIDLSAGGHQPMPSLNRRYWITYNGEIYNYIELRNELKGYGHEFQSESDTEVVIKAFEQWGKECLSHFNGMFAFVIYDSFTKSFFAARDRFGVKPLYYWTSPGGTLAFASEIKQFTPLPGWQARMEHQSVYNFLNWGLKDSGEETFFSGVKQLKGGHYLSGQLDSHEPITPCQWYAIPEQPFEGSFEDAGARLSDLLKDSIRIRLRADVDVGSCLSGGLDSSTIVCFVNDLLKEQKSSISQKTFSACSQYPQFDESKYVSSVAQMTNIEAHAIVPGLDTLEELAERLVWHQDEPYGSTSIYAQWLVFDLVKQHRIKVMLDGQGADEQLAGYESFFGSHFYELFRSFEWIKLLEQMHHTRRIHNHINPIFLLGNYLLPDGLKQMLRRGLGKPAINPCWINNIQLNVLDVDPIGKGNFKNIRDLSTSQLTQASLPMLLHYEDRNSMAHSVEARTPFLDYRIVEFALGLPTQYKISHGITKRVLRKAVEGVIPENVRRRVDKMGFVTSEEVWLRQKRPQLFRQWIDRAIESSDGILNANLRNYLDQMISGSKKFDYLPWRAISFGHWIEKFSVKK